MRIFDLLKPYKYEVRDKQERSQPTHERSNTTPENNDLFWKRLNTNGMGMRPHSSILTATSSFSIGLDSPTPSKIDKLWRFPACWWTGKNLN